MTFSRTLFGTLIVLGLVVQPAGAERPFYQGKVVTLLVSTSPGGSTDYYARLVARLLPKYIPGKPKIAVMNRPGAGGLLAANWVYHIAKKDGLTLGAINHMLPLKGALGAKGARFDPAQFNWIGTPVQGTAACFVRSNSRIKTFNDLVKAKQTVTMAATDRRSDTFIVPLMLNSVFDTNMTVTSGYGDINATASAVLKGEVDGSCGWSHVSLKALEKTPKAGEITILKGVPPAASTVADDSKKAILNTYNKQLSVGLPWVMPPGVPQNRVETMREAFARLMTDPDFRADATKAGIAINALSGQELQTVMQEIVNLTQEDKRELKELFNY